MSEVDVILRERVKKTEQFLQEQLEKFQKPVNEAKLLFRDFNKTLLSFKKTNNVAVLEQLCAQLKEKNANYAGQSVNECDEETKSMRGRPKRNAFRQALSNIQTSKNITVDCTNEQFICVKQERTDSEGDKENIPSNIKSKPITDMPPPSITAVLRKNAKIKVESNRRPRTRSRKITQCDTDNNDEENNKETRNSNVIVECNNISSIENAGEEDVPKTPKHAAVEQSKSKYGPSIRTIEKNAKIKVESNRRPRTRTRKVTQCDTDNNNEENNKETRNSNVIVECNNISFIENAGEKDVPKTPKHAAVEQSKSKYGHSIRTIEKNESADENCKRLRSSSEDLLADEQKKTKKRKKAKDQKNKEQKTIRDSIDCTASSAEENIHNNVNKEMVQQNKLFLDQTVTISTGRETNIVTKPTFFDMNGKLRLQEQQNGRINLNEITTYDKSENEEALILDKTVLKKTKQIFSTVKKKVDAFEKLGACVDSPCTRTRLRMQNKAKDLNSSKLPIKQFSSVPFNRYLPSTQNTTIKKNGVPASNRSIIMSKSVSASKATHAEYIKRELQRKQKEAEIIRKKEAMLVAAAEEMRRKHEEKQLKAQQIREALEKDKQKKREETENKRIIAKKKAEEEKHKKEETKRVQQRVISAGEKAASKPIYMIQKAPLLPSTDCYYDSDKDNSDSLVSDWEKKTSLTLTGYRILKAGNQLKNTFFSVAPKTLDLHELFPSIEPHKLTRSSSAMWTKPPRYTSFMSPLNEDSD